jgi:hypothetical protein
MHRKRKVVSCGDQSRPRFDVPVLMGNLGRRAVNGAHCLAIPWEEKIRVGFVRVFSSFRINIIMQVALGRWRLVPKGLEFIKSDDVIATGVSLTVVDNIIIVLERVK